MTLPETPPRPEPVPVFPCRWHAGAMIIGGVITTAVGLVIFLAYYVAGNDLPILRDLNPLISGIVIPMVFLIPGGLLILLGFLLCPSNRK